MGDTQTVKEVGDGCRLISIKQEEGPVNIRVLEIDILRENLELKVAISSDRLGKKLERTSSMVSREQANGHVVLGAINADFFNYSDKLPINEMIAQGAHVFGFNSQRTQFGIVDQKRLVMGLRDFSAILKIEDTDIPVSGINYPYRADSLTIFNHLAGETLADDSSASYLRLHHLPLSQLPSRQFWLAGKKTRGWDGISPDSCSLLLKGGVACRQIIDSAIQSGDTLAIMINEAMDGMKWIESVGGGPRLVVDGKILENYCGEEGFGSSFTDNRHPRSAIGFNQDSSRLYLVAVDGRQEGYSVGMTIRELAELMVSLGCFQAMNFDGGGSTTLTVGDSVVNSPSDAKGERAVANALMVIETRPARELLRQIYILPDTPLIMVDQPFQLKVRAYDVYHHLLPLEPCDLDWQFGGLPGFADSMAIAHIFEPGQGWLTASCDSIRDSVPFLACQMEDWAAESDSPVMIPLLFERFGLYINPTANAHLHEIGCTIPFSGRLNIAVYNVLGEKIETLLDQPAISGFYKTSWDSARMPVGVYFLGLLLSTQKAPIPGWKKTKQFYILPENCN